MLQIRDLAGPTKYDDAPLTDFTFSLLESPPTSKERPEGSWDWHLKFWHACPCKYLFVRRLGAWDFLAARLEAPFVRRLGAWDSLTARLEAPFVRCLGAWDSRDAPLAAPFVRRLGAWDL